MREWKQAVLALALPLGLVAVTPEGFWPSPRRPATPRSGRASKRCWRR